MINEYLDKPLEVGTVLKETYPDGIAYYIVGEYFVYDNDYEYPQIRPHKFYFDEHISIANEEESKFAFESFKQNHLIWNEKTGKITREFDEHVLSVKVRCLAGTPVDKILNILNNMKITGDPIINVSFKDF